MQYRTVQVHVTAEESCSNVFFIAAYSFNHAINLKKLNHSCVDVYHSVNKYIVMNFQGMAAPMQVDALAPPKQREISAAVAATSSLADEQTVIA